MKHLRKFNENKQLSKESFKEVVEDLMVHMKDNHKVVEISSHYQNISRFEVEIDNIGDLFEDLATLTRSAENYKLKVEVEEWRKRFMIFVIICNIDIESAIRNLLEEHDMSELETIFNKNRHFVEYSMGHILFHWPENLESYIKYILKSFPSASPHYDEHSNELSCKIDDESYELIKYIYNLLKSNNLL